MENEKKKAHDAEKTRRNLITVLIVSSIILILTVTWAVLAKYGLLVPIWNKITRILFVLIVPPFVAFVFAVVCAPVMRLFKKMKFNNKLAAVICVLLVALVLAAVLIGIIAAAMSAISNIDVGLIEDIISRLENIPLFENIKTDEGLGKFILDFLNQDPLSFNSGIIEVIAAITSSFFNLVLILTAFPVFMFFMLKEADIIKINVKRAVPEKFKKHYDALADKFVNITRSYIAGTFYESLFMFLATLVCYYILGGIIAATGMPANAFLTWAPLIFALIVAVTQIVPYIGAVAGAVIPILYGIVVYIPLDKFWVIIAIIIINFFIQIVIDNFLLRPWLFSKAIKVHPLLLISGIMVAGVLFGFWGILLSVAIVGFAKETVIYVYGLWKEKHDNVVSGEENGKESEKNYDGKPI